MPETGDKQKILHASRDLLKFTSLRKDRSRFRMGLDFLKQQWKQDNNEAMPLKP